MSKLRNPSKNIRAKASIAILITAALLMMLISGIQYYTAHKEIRDNLEKNAEMELVIKALNIRQSLSSVELALQNHRWEVEQLLAYPDSLFGVTRRIVEQNPDLNGCCIAMIPDYYSEKGRLFEPYTSRNGSDIITYQLASEEHDYTKGDQYIHSTENDTAYWGEPYFYEEGGVQTTLITYSFPIHDALGRVVGLVAADLDGDWLGSVLNSRHFFPSSYDFLLSGQGRLICGPEEREIKHQAVEKMVNMLNDSTIKRTRSISGNTQLLTFNDNGSKGYVFHVTPKLLKPWQLAVVNYEDEVFDPIVKMRRRNFLLMLLGLLALGFIIHRSAKDITRLQKANMENERIENELNIARKIQMDMVPKTFPPFPERNDINIYGTLVPAKLVGGDLYDFFIRDEKLYFCIGDVSGKSVPGALVMAAGYTLYHSLAAHESNPSRIMQALNEALSKDNETNMFVTMFIGVLDLPTGKLRYCNAGHEKPFVIVQKVRALPVKPHLPLGVVDDMIYTTQEDILAKGEIVFLYTDGLTEAMNLKHELFGIKRIENVLESFKEQGGIPTEGLINTVSRKVTAFVGDGEQSDDLTLLAVQYTPQEKPLVLHESLMLTNKVSEISKLNAFVTSAMTKLALESSLVSKIKLAVEEAVTNCIEYAYPAGTIGDVNVDIEADDSKIRFIITDTGFDFDPTKVSKVDTTLSVDERPIGGLGIFLVRNLMDSINYERSNGRNILRIEKRYFG